MNTETERIEKYFRRPGSAEVLVGIGDGGAVLRNKAPSVVCSDTAAAAAHFSEEAAASAAGHKALAVNLSDMAAMGAAPRWAPPALMSP